MNLVYLFLAQGFEEIEAVVPIDILRRAGAKVQTVGVGGRAIRGSHNIEITADIMLQDISDNADMLILPGGLPGADNLQQSSGVINALNNCNNKGKYIAAICAAPKILGEAGLLQGKTATCFPGFEKHLHGANVTSNAVEIDGNIVTAKGAGAAYEFDFPLAGILFGSEKAT